MATKKSSNVNRKNRRKRSWERCNLVGGKKDKRVERSSGGKFKSRTELKKHTEEVRNSAENVEKREIRKHDRRASRLGRLTWVRAFAEENND